MSEGKDNVLTEQEVLHVAKLARINLSSQEVAKFANQLGDIIGYVQKLNKLDTTDVQPTAHAVPLKNVFREDKARQGIKPEEALKNAPDKEDNFFRVPRVLDESSA